MSNQKKIIDIKELLDFALTKHYVMVNENDIDNIMFSYGLKFNSKCEEI